MPARRRGQEAKRAERRRRKAQSTHDRAAHRRARLDDLDHCWDAHQEWERARRVAPLIEPPKPTRRPFDIFAVLRRVEADFARWKEQG